METFIRKEIEAGAGTFARGWTQMWLVFDGYYVTVQKEEMDMSRVKVRILANSGRGAYAIHYSGKTGRQLSEAYLEDGTEAYLPLPSVQASEASVAPGQRLDGAMAVLLKEGRCYYHYDVFPGDRDDQCRVIPERDARQCPHCSSWLGTIEGRAVGRHYEGCPTVVE